MVYKFGLLLSIRQNDIHFDQTEVSNQLKISLFYSTNHYPREKTSGMCATVHIYMGFYSRLEFNLFTFELSVIGGYGGGIPSLVSVFQGSRLIKKAIEQLPSLHEVNRVMK